MSASDDRPSILQATAQNRVIAAYEVAPDRVAPQLPDGLVPDTRDGRAFVTIVGVQLIKLRVLGVSGPGFRRVPAVELQVLVQETKAPDRRGTITVQAHVPRHVVAWGARVLYKEPVSVAPMQPVRRERGETIEMTYRFDVAGREQRLRAVGTHPPVMPAPDTRGHFLLDRSWRYGAGPKGGRVRTRIERPVAPVCRVAEHHVTVQWRAVYGEEWGFLTNREPTFAVLVPGSPVTLRWRERRK